MAAITATAADKARGNAFRNAFQQLLLNGTTDGGGFTVGNPVPPTTSPSSLNLTLDMWELAFLAAMMIAENTSLPGGNPTTAGQNPLQVPSFTNGAALTAAFPAAAAYQGALALDLAGPCLCYCDGTNWRRADTNSTTLP